MNFQKVASVVKVVVLLSVSSTFGFQCLSLCRSEPKGHLVVQSYTKPKACIRSYKLRPLNLKPFCLGSENWRLSVLDCKGEKSNKSVGRKLISASVLSKCEQ